MKIIIDNRVRLSILGRRAMDVLCQALTIPNPAYEEARKMGRFTGKIPCLLRFYEPTMEGLILPRGYIRHVYAMAKASGEAIELDDRRRTLPEVDFSFNGSLRDYQEGAVNAVIKKDFGTLTAPTGSGKTVMALAIIAKRRQPALIIVHTKELLDQWSDRIETFLGVPRDEIGIIGGGKMRIGDRITVGMAQTLHKCAGEVSPHIGHLIVDECHRTPSSTFSDVVKAFDSRYMLGLSATPYRRDGLSKLIFWTLGDTVHQVDQASLTESGAILPGAVVIRETDFRTSLDPSSQYSRMLSELTEDIGRNRLIAGDVSREAKTTGGVLLVLSDRKPHCERLKSLLDEHGLSADVLTGETPTKERRNIVDRLNAGNVRVLIATGQLIGEGFDCKSLSSLFLATPVKFSGRVVQYLGRVLRPAPGKSQARVFDYIDGHVGQLVASARSRRKVYADAGMEVAHG